MSSMLMRESQGHVRVAKYCVLSRKGSKCKDQTDDLLTPCSQKYLKYQQQQSVASCITMTTLTSSTQYETTHSPSMILFASLLSIPSFYKTTEVCPTDSETTKSFSSKDFIMAKASTKAESISDYIMVPLCNNKLSLLYTTAEI